MNTQGKITKDIQTCRNIADAFAAAGSQHQDDRNPAIVKLTKSGDWVHGRDKTPLANTRFVADVEGAAAGFICFKSGGGVEKAMAPVASGKLIRRDDLQDHGPYRDGDGWTECLSLPLRSVENGEEYVFEPTSIGGRAAIRQLFSEYGRWLRSGRSGLPVIELEATSYQHPRYGTVFKPVLKIVGWQDENAPGNGVAPDFENDSIPF